MQNDGRNAVRQIPRDLAAHYGLEAVRICEAGQYTSASGRVVNIAEALKRAMDGTRSYPPDRPLVESKPGQHATVTRVENETTLAAARDLIARGFRPAVLNFASATHPGGGFLNGARAQEEYLARSSGLYACIKGNAMYAFHRARHDALYTHYAIYSPDVPVWRADDGRLLDEIYTVGVITCPAANVNALAPERRHEVGPAMWQRILKVLAIGIEHGHDAIVLGAWGCGAFGNDSNEIAALFQRALAENFKGAYRAVTFAILDWSPEQRFIVPFRSAFRV